MRKWGAATAGWLLLTLFVVAWLNHRGPAGDPASIETAQLPRVAPGARPRTPGQTTPQNGGEPPPEVAVVERPGSPARASFTLCEVAEMRASSLEQVVDGLPVERGFVSVPHAMVYVDLMQTYVLIEQDPEWRVEHCPTPELPLGELLEGFARALEASGTGPEWEPVQAALTDLRELRAGEPVGAGSDTAEER